jgi:hypothetical protein
VNDVSDSSSLETLRAVHDLSRLEPKRLVERRPEPCLLVELVPAEDSGSATIPGAYVDAATGDIVQPDDAEVVVVHAGTWRVVASLAGEAKTDGGEYRWQEAQEFDRRGIDPDDIYSPFIRGGLILCRLNVRKRRDARFAPRWLIPREWEEDVVRAFGASDEWQDLVRDATGKADRGRLERLWAGRNAFLAALAVTRLRERMTPSDALELLRAGDGRGDVRRAVLAHAALAGAETPEDAADMAGRVVEEAGSEVVAGLALAAAALAVFAADARERSAGGAALVRIGDARRRDVGSKIEREDAELVDRLVAAFAPSPAAR